MLARAVARQLRLDQPAVSAGDVRAHVRAWTVDQGVGAVDSVVDAAMAAENLS